MAKESYVDLWVPEARPKETEGVRCYFRTRKVCTNYGVFLSKGIVSDSNFQTPTSLHDCKTAWKTFRYKNQPLSKISDQLFSTNNSLHVDYRYCCYDFCSTVVNFILELGTVASYDGHKIFSSLGDMGWLFCNRRIMR